MLLINLVFAKQYERCELARELIWKHNVPLKNIGMWVCIAEQRSNLNTDLFNTESYGLFQVQSNIIYFIFRCLINLITF